jgi:hypothetical protein
MIKNCLICGKSFYTKPARIKDGRGKFCSTKCYGKWRSEKFVGSKNPLWKNIDRKRICKICGKEFLGNVSRIGKSNFCSIKCCTIYQRRNIQKRNCIICNKSFFIKAYQAKKGVGKFCSPQCHGKWKSQNLTGENSPAWKGGIDSINHRIRMSIEYRLWREAVFARDGWTCQKCKQIGGQLNAHHIKSFSKFPELRFAIDNGQTLCQDCHNITKGTRK